MTLQSVMVKRRAHDAAVWHGEKHTTLQSVMVKRRAHDATVCHDEKNSA